MNTDISLATRIAEGAAIAPSPNWLEGWLDAILGKPNRIASPNYCEGYAAAHSTVESCTA